MKNAKVHSSPYKKGLSLSLSKKSGLSCSVQNTPISIKKETQSWQFDRKSLPLQRPSQLFSDRTIVNIKAVNRPPVIIYRYQKSQWQKLQETNKIKRQEVDKMKTQLQTLNRELELKKYILPRQSNSVKNIQNTPVNLNFSQQIIQGSQHTNSKPLSPDIFIKKAAEKAINSLEQTYKININGPKVPLKPQNSTCELHKFPIKSSGDENINPLAKNINCVLEQKKHTFREKRNNIDVDSLLEIQNRLNRLIDFTNF